MRIAVHLVEEKDEYDHVDDAKGQCVEHAVHKIAHRLEYQCDAEHEEDCAGGLHHVGVAELEHLQAKSTPIYIKYRVDKIILF